MIVLTPPGFVTGALSLPAGSMTPAQDITPRPRVAYITLTGETLVFLDYSSIHTGGFTGESHVASITPTSWGSLAAVTHSSTVAIRLTWTVCCLTSGSIPSRLTLTGQTGSDARPMT